MPEANPAPAPHMGLIHAFGTDVEYTCIREKIGCSEDEGPGGIVVKLLEVVGSSCVAC